MTTPLEITQGLLLSKKAKTAVKPKEKAPASEDLVASAAELSPRASSKKTVEVKEKKEENEKTAATLKCQKLTKGSDLKKLQEFIAGYRIQTRKMKATGQPIFIDFDATDAFDNTTPENANEPETQYLLKHPVSGFYLFFEDKSNTPIGLMILHPINAQGYIEQSLAFYQEKSGKGYGKAAMALIFQKTERHIGKLIENSEGKKVYLKGFCGDIDVRNSASLTLYAISGFAVSDYIHKVFPAPTLAPEHYISFSYPKLKAEASYDDCTCTMPDTLKKEKTELFQKFGKELVAKRGLEAHIKVITKLQNVALPLYEQHRNKVEAYKNKIKEVLALEFSKATPLEGRDNVSEKFTAGSRIITHVQEYFVSPDLTWQAAAEKKKKKR